MRLAILIAVLALFALVFAPSRAERALADGDRNAVTLVGVDLGAAAATDRDGDVAVTAAAIVANAHDAGTVAILGYASVPSEVEKYSAKDGSGGAIAHLAAAIDQAAGGRSDQIKAISAAFEYLSDADAPAGSRFVLVTSDGAAGQSSDARERMTGFAALFAKQGWSVDAVMLPSSSPAAREFLTALALAGSGRSYDAGTLDGLAALVAGEAGALGAPAIETQLGSGDSALAPIEVAPHSDSISITFLRFSPRASFELFDPRGARIDPARSRSVTVFETPSVVAMEVMNPEAGTWSLRAAGAGTEVRAAVDVVNPLVLGLVPQPPVPAGKAGVLAAAATASGEPVALPGATVEATVRGQEGKTVVYKLLDDGRGVDEKAGDGVFSVALPAADAQSLYEVGLKLSWANYGATLSGAGSFKIELFPAVRVTPLSGAPIAKGAEAAIARVDVEVGRYPYPVAANELKIKVIADSGASVLPRLLPVNPLPDGRAWQYHVMASPVDSGGYAVTADLAVVHLGRAFQATASGPAAQVEILPPPPVPGIPAWVFAAAAAAGLVVVLGAALAINARRPVPAGYLYDDKGRMLYDFSATRQSFLRRLLSRNYVPCAEIALLPVNTGAFVFGRRGVELRYPGRNQSLRVNGRPAGNRVRLAPGTWLGFGGRLMTYSLERRRKELLQPEESADTKATEAKSAPHLTPANPPVRRVMPGYVPGRLQASQDPAQPAHDEHGEPERRREDEPPAQAAASPSPAGD